MVVKQLVARPTPPHGPTTAAGPASTGSLELSPVERQAQRSVSMFTRVVEWAPCAKEEAMRHSKRKTKITTTLLALALLVGWSASPALAQAPPSYSPEQLDRLVSQIALYPDPL